MDFTDDNPDKLICASCVSEIQLASYVLQNGSTVVVCPVCKTSNVKAVSASDPIFSRLVRAFVRFYYSEWDYNTHLGGEQLESLMIQDRHIFKLPTNANLLAFEDAWLEIEEEPGWYPENEEGISLGGGYWDGGILQGISRVPDHAVLSTLSRALKENSTEIRPAVLDLLKDLAPDIQTPIPVGSHYFRARVGVANVFTQRDVETLRYFYVPYRDSHIGAPPVQSATPGRLNRQHHSYLYVATDVETAIAEVRPDPGHLVSTGGFETRAEVTVLDFSGWRMADFLSDSRLDRLREINTIDQLLSAPIPHDHRHLFLMTQIVADCASHLGFDGVAFKSSVGPGKNYTFFDPSHLGYLPEFSTAVEVLGVQYQMAPVPLVSDRKSPGPLQEGHEPLDRLMILGRSRR